MYPTKPQSLPTDFDYGTGWEGTRAARAASEPSETVETSYLVEWWDEVTGQWADIGEAANRTSGLARIYGLVAHDEARRDALDADAYEMRTQRYRLVETTTTTVDV